MWDDLVKFDHSPPFVGVFQMTLLHYSVSKEQLSPSTMLVTKRKS